MFAFELKKFQVWLMMALLCYSVFPYSCYPQAEEDEFPTEAEENLDNEEDEEEVQDEDEDSTEELEAPDDEENDDPSNFDAAKTCVVPRGQCGKDQNSQLLPCCRDEASGDYYQCEKYLTSELNKCTRLRNEAAQVAMKAWAKLNKV